VNTSHEFSSFYKTIIFCAVYWVFSSVQYIGSLEESGYDCVAAME